MADTANFVVKNNQAFVNVPFMKIYIPDEYFEYSISEFIGARLSTLGIFYIETFQNDDYKNGKLYLFRVPSNIIIPFNQKEKEKVILEGEEESVTAFYFNKNDLFLESVSLRQEANNSAQFINLLHSGKLPTSIGYSKVIQLYLQNLSLNDVDLRVPAFTLETIIAELSRVYDNLAIPFRKEIGKENTTYDDHQFRFTNIKNIPHLTSTFSSIAFEDMGKSLVASINRSRHKDAEASSPIEKTIRF
jgi:hypothetical protein